MTHKISSKNSPVFARIRFIMVHPSHPGNVGATARAIKTMGFDDLFLVSPRHANVATHPDAVAMASGASDVLNAAHECATLDDALASTTLAFALTARPRDMGPPTCDIREAAGLGQTHLGQHPDGRVAFVLGTERAGLSNGHIALCQRICHIPANPDYSSLNVSQAAQLVAWELRYALANAAALPLLPDTNGTAEPGDQPATSDNVQAFIKHLETALITTRFLDPDHPKKLMTHMRHLFGRCELTQNETNMLRGMCTAMIKAANKHLD